MLLIFIPFFSGFKITTLRTVEIAYCQSTSWNIQFPSSSAPVSQITPKFGVMEVANHAARLHIILQTPNAYEKILVQL